MEELMQSLSQVDNKTTLLTVEHKEITMDKRICYEFFFLKTGFLTLTPKTIVNCSFSLSFGKYQNAFFIQQNVHVRGFFLFVPVLFAQLPKALTGPDI